MSNGKPKPTPTEAQPVEAQPVEASVSPPLTLEKSFDLMFDRLDKLDQAMTDSDKAVYHAVGKFVDKANEVTQNTVRIALEIDDCLDLASGSMSEEDLYQRLKQRFAVLRPETDMLFLTAYSDAEMETVIKRDQFLERMANRIKALEPKDRKPPVVDNLENNDLGKLSVSELRIMAKARGLKGYSKRNKKQLIELLKSVGC